MQYAIHRIYGCCKHKYLWGLFELVDGQWEHISTHATKADAQRKKRFLMTSR